MHLDFSLGLFPNPGSLCAEGTASLACTAGVWPVCCDLKDPRRVPHSLLYSFVALAKRRCWRSTVGFSVPSPEAGWFHGHLVLLEGVLRGKTGTDGTTLPTSYLI